MNIPCKKCGSEERYANGNCKPCHRNSVAKWRAANIKKDRERKAKHYDANAEMILQSHAKYRALNKEKVRECNAKYRAANPERAIINSHTRRAMKKAVGGKLSLGLAGKLFKLQRGKCACGCARPLGDDYHLDHRMPLALGGTNTDDNMQLLLGTCNLRKHAKHPIDFMQSRGFLL